MKTTRRGVLTLGTSAVVGAGLVVTDRSSATPRLPGAFPLDETPVIPMPGSVWQAKRDTFSLRDLLYRELPYVTAGVPPLPTGENFESNGVAIRRYDGVVHNHPVAQAQLVLSMLSGYALTSNSEYLRIARANADRLLMYAVPSRGGLFFPYPFKFALHGGSDVMTAPWYSGMAQGQALSAFCRLFEVTEDGIYLNAAMEAFESLKLLKSNSEPWVTRIDAHGYAWFEEYADATTRTDFTFNGHLFGVYGCYDYFRLTGTEEARRLYQIGLTTVKRYADTIRTPGWISKYCLRHETLSISYHNVHVKELYKMFDMTGDIYFASLGDAFLADFPRPSDRGEGNISQGSHNFAATDPSGERVTNISTITTPVITGVTFGSRRRLVGAGGVWLRIDSGRHAGKWVEERPGATYIRGLRLQNYLFAVPRLVQFDEGDHTGYVFSYADGSVIREHKQRLRGPSGAHCDMQALINGQLHLRITNGIWAGMWIPATPGSRLATVELTGEIVGDWDPDVNMPYRIEPVRLVWFAGGAHIGYAFDESWQTVDTKRAVLRRDSGAFTDRRVQLDSGMYYHITGGIWKGMWVPASGKVLVND